MISSLIIRHHQGMGSLKKDQFLIRTKMMMMIWIFLLFSVAIGEGQEYPLRCGGERRGSIGVITSPGFPYNYLAYTECKWDIIAPLNHRVTLRFHSLEVEKCENCGCDYVRIDSVNSDGIKLEEKICGSHSNLTYTSEENHMRVTFISDGDRENKGFMANYHVTEDQISQDQVNLTESKNRNIQWLLKKKRSRLEYPRVLLALFLADAKLFHPENKTFTELKDSLTIRILAQISRNETILTHELALYVQALLVTCQDPRNFYGHDLLSELRSRVDASTTFANPFEILALCNAGADVTAKDVERVSAAFDSQHRPFWTDIQAIATMAMQCLSSKLKVDERVITDMQDELKKRQFANGTVENLVTTALVVQALGYKNSSAAFFDLPSAMDVLLKAQEEDGSWARSVRNSFYILPAVSEKSFLDINDKHCPQKTETDEETLARLQKAGGDKFVVQYSVWIGGDVDLGRTWRVRVQSGKNISFYDVMEMVSKMDKSHNVTYQVVDGKPYVRAMQGKEDDPDMGIFWFTYVRSTSSKASLKLVESSPADINVFPNQELILWYKSNDWSSSNP